MGSPDEPAGRRSRFAISRARATVLAATLLAAVAALVGFLSLDQSSQPKMVALIALPLGIVACQAFGVLRWRAVLLLAVLLLDAEAVISALNFAVGGILAVLLPFVSVSFARLHPDRRVLVFAAVAGLATTMVAFALVVVAGPISGLITIKIPTIVVLCTSAVGVAALEWAAWVRHQGVLDGLAEEVVARSAAEREARDSAEEIRSILDAASDAVLVVDDDGCLQDANQAAVRIVGKPLEEIVHHPLAELVAQPDGDGTGSAGLAPTWSSIVADHELHKLGGLHQVVGRRPDGSSFPAEVSVSCFETRGATSHVAVIRDISDREATNAELARTREVLSAILEASPFSIVSTDTTGRVQFFNRAAERLLGRSASDALGRPVAEMAPVSPAEYAALHDRLMRGEVIQLDPTRHVSEDGRVIDTRSYIAPLMGPNHTVVGAVAITEDVTEHLRLEAQLQQSQKMETLGQLSGAIAHDFNNLLQAIHGYAELATAAAPEGSELRTNLSEIQRAADRAAELTRQLLAFSQPSRAGARVVEINSAIAQAAPMIRRLLGPTVELTTILDREVGNVFVDPGQLEQAILNLAVNGRDAMPQGGSMTIATARGDGDPATAHIWVRDTGSGISDEIREHIFDPFFTTKPSGQGTGLGLTIVNRIVRTAGGEIVVESSRGAGTSFLLTLPTVQAGADEGSETVETSMHGTETILLVEDEASIRRLAERVLTGHGYRVLSAANADEAREQWRLHGTEVDLLLSDVTMPGLSGPAFAAEISANSRPFRILFVSGHLPSDPSVPSLPVQAQFLQKPFTIGALLSAVRESLDSPAAMGSGVAVSSHAEAATDPS